MPSSEYWKERFELLEEMMNDESSDYVKETETIYRKAISNTEKEISRWYTRFAEKEGISYQRAVEMLTGDELKEFHMDVKEYIEKGKTLGISDKWAKELERASTKVHVSRLEALKLQMQQQAEVLTAQKSSGIDNLLRDIYQDSFYKTAYEIQKGIGVGYNFAKLDKKQIDKIMHKPWAADGSNFSERIWGSHRAQLVNKLHEGLTLNLIQGKEPRALINEISDIFQVDRKRAATLVYTEKAYFQSLAQRDSFKNLGVEEYEIVATLDTKTSEICRLMDGKHFKLDDFQVGSTAPPFHPRCFDKDTEIYTNNGWKLLKDLNADDLVYTIDKDTLIPEWQKPIKFVEYKYKGNMIHFKNERADLAVTPNHDILVQNMDSSVKDKSFKLKRADSVGRKSKNRMFSGANWLGKDIKTVVLGGKEVDIVTYLKFMAYWLADGSCSKNGNSYAIKIAQCNNDWMFEDLKELPFKIYKCKESLMIHNKELGEELVKFGKCNEKYIPSLIKELTPELIQVFLIAYAKTDGHIKKGKLWKGCRFGDDITFFTTSNKLSSDLGELILKAGGRPSFRLEKRKGTTQIFRNGTYTINHDLWYISWNKQLYSWICYMDIEDMPYDDFVYCIEVEKHNTLLVRRNGKVVWSGNCRTATAPYFDDEFEDNVERAARDENDKYYTVPAKMKYNDWYRAFVENNEEYLLKIKKESNLYNDKKMFASMKEILGSEHVPESFESFQDLKYNNLDEWNDLKLLYSATNKGHILQKRLDYIWSGGKNFIPTGTALIKIKTIARKDSDQPIRDISRLVSLYGGNQEDWSKKVAKVVSDKYIFDLHWYECNKTQYEVKVKMRKDRVK